MSHDNPRGSGQTPASIARNIAFFREHHEAYRQNIQALDTYASIRTAINDALRGVQRLLDIGNGGVFDYDTTIVPSIVALDLFFEEPPAAFACPPNVTLKTGSALAIPEPSDSFDGVLMVMLIHHLVGPTVDDSLGNVEGACREAFRVLRPGGKLIVVESCVPSWFYAFERLVFPLASRFIGRFLPHPMTLQYPTPVIAEVLEKHGRAIEVLPIPKGRWVFQYGYKYPSRLTPANPYRFIANKSSGPQNVLAR
jgi:SAM-dependent methyltransferase